MVTGGEVLRGLLPLAWMGVLWGLSSVPGGTEAGSPLASIPPLLQNALHVLAFGLLARLWVFTLRGRRPLVVVLVSSFTLTIAYAVVDEIRQAFVPGRTSSSLDVGLDALGAGLAVGFVAMVRVRNTRIA